MEDDFNKAAENVRLKSVEHERVIMPFGKYKGEMLGDIPRPYLLFISDNAEHKDALQTSIEIVLGMMK